MVIATVVVLLQVPAGVRQTPLPANMMLLTVVVIVLRLPATRIGQKSYVWVIEYRVVLLVSACC